MVTVIAGLPLSGSAFATDFPGTRSSQVISSEAAESADSSAMMKPGTSTGRMPEKLLVSDRAIATAGLANEVDAVNQ